jgi:lipopolysaccharide transport system permease protein
MTMERLATTSAVTDEAQAPLARRHEKPMLEVSGGPGGISRESLHELWIFREVLYAFLVRQVKVKYKQAAIGIGWAVIQPVIAAALFALFLGKLSNVGSEGAPYLLFALAGMAAWTYFSGAAGGAMESLISDQALLRKVYFPREVLPLAAVGAGLVDFLSALGTLLVAALLYGLMPAVPWLVLPLPVLLLAVSAAALGLGLSGINVYYRDVRYALPFVLQLGLFASPIVYPLSAVPGTWRTVYAILNPVAAAIDALRRIVIHQTWPDFSVTFAALGWALLLALGGYVLFKRLERGFSDRV